MRKLSQFVVAGTLVVACGLASSTMAQSVSYVSGTYTQDFDSLASVSGPTNAWSNGTTLNGWYSFFANSTVSNTTRDASNTTTTNYRSDNGNAGALYSYGVAGVNPVTERALGSVGSGSFEGVYGVAIQNNTGFAIDSFTITVDGEQWRNGGNAASQSLLVDYTVLSGVPAIADMDAANVAGYTGLPALTFTSPITGATALGLDGNYDGTLDGRPNNFIRNLTTTQTGLSIAPGQYILIRWWDNNDSGNDHSLSIDNFRFSATPTPGAISLLGLAGLAALRRRRA